MPRTFTVPESMRCKATVTNPRSKNLGKQCPNHRQRDRKTGEYFEYCSAHRGVPQRAARLDADRKVAALSSVPEVARESETQRVIEESSERQQLAHESPADEARAEQEQRANEFVSRPLTDHEKVLSDHETAGILAETDLLRKQKVNDETRESWAWARRGDFAPLPFPEVENVEPALARLFGMPLTWDTQKDLNERARTLGDEIPFPGIERLEKKNKRGPRRMRGSIHPLEGRGAR
jgi:hypothetical protein